MSIHRIVRFNLMLVLGIGLYGLLTDEPYWRSNGHYPGLYDYLFWFGLVLNAPSGVTADYLPRLIMSNSSNLELRFVVQYGLWLLLLWPQWKGYDLLVTWCMGPPRRETALRVVAVGVAMIGGIAGYRAWIFGHRLAMESEFMFIDRYFWFVRVAGLAVSGLVILAYGQLAKRRCAL
jgi:hypothetical protein